MSLAFETKDEPGYHNGRSTELAFQFRYSNEDYASHLPFFNDLTPSEETKMNSFLKFVDEIELKSKRQPEEIKDITEAVDEVVDSFVEQLEKQDPILAVSHKYAVGSMAEGTKIKEPDEFDFILVLKELNTDTVSLETIHKEDIYIECDTECMLYKNHYHVPRPVIQKCTSEIDYKHVHLPLKNLADFNRNKKFPGKWKRLGYACCWKNHFLQRLQKDSDCLLRFLDLKKTKSTGTIKIIHKDIHEIITINGPAMTLDLLWEPKTGNELEISVDLVLAIEMKGVEKVIDSEKNPSQIYHKMLLETDQFFLVPIQAADNDVCFKVTVTTTEQTIMANLSKAHILCYRILKYLFQQKQQSYDNMLSSYFLKTFLLQHAALRNSEDNPAQCLTDILKLLAIAIKYSKLVQKPDISLEHLFIPGLILNNDAELEDISKYLTANAEQLFKAAKSKHNKDIENLQGMKDVWKQIEKETLQDTKNLANAMLGFDMYSIAKGPGEQTEKLRQISSLASSFQFLLPEE